jgi:hypothetical protein
MNCYMLLMILNNLGLNGILMQNDLNPFLIYAAKQPGHCAQKPYAGCVYGLQSAQ